MLNFSWHLVAFIVAIGVLVSVHEFGHFWVARRLGFKVLRFSIGFGRPLLRWSGRAPEADRKAQNLESEPAGDPEVPELVNRDEHADRDDEKEQSPGYVKHPIFQTGA